MSDDENASFDPKRIAEAARRADLSELLGAAMLRKMDPEALARIQAANMKALLSAQKKAAAEYQISFETSLNALEAALGKFDGALTGANALEQDRVAEAYERAIVEFQKLNKHATDANLKTFETVRREVEKGASVLKRDVDEAER